MRGEARLEVTCGLGAMLAGVAGIAGCGNMPYPAGPGSPINAVVSGDEGNEPGAFQPLDPCDPERPLKVAVVFEGASLTRTLGVLELPAGQSVPPFDPTVLGISAEDRTLLMVKIVERVSDAFAPFDLVVTADDAGDVLAEASDADEIARIFVTQVEGGPTRCACQGATAELGLVDGGAAEGLVLANAFEQNGFANAILGYSRGEQIELAAVALSNSIVHEAGHTLGLVHIDVPGPPVYFMARGGNSSTSVSLAAMTRVQEFSSDEWPVTPDARIVRAMQCDTCVIRQTVEQRRQCAAYEIANVE